MLPNNNLQKNLSPIALFVYNRPEHTKKTVEALQKNNLAKESELFIFSDGYKNEESKNKVEEVRNYIKTIGGFKKIEIIERSENLGLAKSIISGVTEIVNKYGKIIVLEDDLVTSPYFLEYMNEALDLYEEEENVISIHGYIYPIKKELPETFFIRGANCWGWATWKRGWDLFEPDGKKLLNELERKNLTKEFDFDNNYHYTLMLKRQIAGLTNSWAVRWYASAFLHNKLTLYPGISLVNNIGQDSSGTHGGNSSVLEVKISKKKIDIKKIPPEESVFARKEMINFFKSLKPSLKQKVIRHIKKLMKRLIKKIVEPFIKLECLLTAKLVFYAYKQLKWIQWRIPPQPEHFDHRIDLYYQWLATRNSHWLERGAFGNLTLKGGNTLELSCGDGFNARNFYSLRSKKVIACDFDKEAIKSAQKNNFTKNVEYVLADIRDNMPKGNFDNIFWDNAIEHFTLFEIKNILQNIKSRMSEEAILSGCTIVEKKSGEKSLSHHEYEFKSKEDLFDLLKLHFKNVTVFETVFPDRHNLYFWASENTLPFDANWSHSIKTIK